MRAAGGGPCLPGFTEGLASGQKVFFFDRDDVRVAENDEVSVIKGVQVRVKVCLCSIRSRTEADPS
jgi:hypothetical protein